MTRTIVASATREIVIGFDQPFCVIGERINPTGRKKLAAEMVEGNFETVKKDALEQAAAGATMLDVNAGVTAVDPNASVRNSQLSTALPTSELAATPAVMERLRSGVKTTASSVSETVNATREASAIFCNAVHPNPRPAA